MDSSLRRALREDDPVAAVIWAQRAGAPSDDLSLWARAFDRLLALPCPEADVTQAEYVAAMIEAEQGSYPCVCSMRADTSCPTHGGDIPGQSSRGARFAAWIRADAVENAGFPTELEAVSWASSVVTRVVRRLAQEL